MSGTTPGPKAPFDTYHERASLDLFTEPKTTSPPSPSFRIVFARCNQRLLYFSWVELGSNVIDLPRLAQLTVGTKNPIKSEGFLPRLSARSVAILTGHRTQDDQELRSCTNFAIFPSGSPREMLSRLIPRLPNVSTFR